MTTTLRKLLYFLLIFNLNNIQKMFLTNIIITIFHFNYHKTMNNDLNGEKILIYNVQKVLGFF